ncbi:MAG: DUF2167 domain-containing protein [Myxococcota bacterium]
MARSVTALAIILFASSWAWAEDLPPPVAGDEEEGLTLEEAFSWKTSGTGQLGDRAEIGIPLDHRFLDGAEASRLLTEMGNISDGDELGLIGSDELEWFVIFFFDDIGYVQDDEKDELDADALAETIRENLEYSNQIREERGLMTMQFAGWAMEPRYNENNQQLEWASRLSSLDGDVVNYNTRVLGRKGVMRVILVTDPSELEATLPQFNSVMQNFRFLDGERYAQYTTGDKIAEYGLVALIAGGAGALAVKTGLFASLLVFLKKGFKFVILGLVAVGAAVKKVFSRRTA